MSTRKRSTSGSKKTFKEKISLIYEAFFRVSEHIWLRSDLFYYSYFNAHYIFLNLKAKAFI